MKMRRTMALVLLALGTVLGFASGFHSLRHGHGLHGGSCYLDGLAWRFGF